MKRLFLLLTLTGCLCFPALAQQIKLEKEVADDTIPRNFGPNLRHYLHFYVGYGFVAGSAENTSSSVKYPASHEWVGGLRYKFKVCEIYALGLEAAFTPQVFKLKQETGKLLPTAALHEAEKLKFSNLGLGFYNRFNWDKRGNYVGNFIDLGVYGNWMFSSVHIFEDDVPNGSPTGAETIKTRESGLKYVEDFNHGVLARIGFNRYVFYGTYRLSDLFEPEFTYQDNEVTTTIRYAELPRYIIGFQLSLHK